MGKIILWILGMIIISSFAFAVLTNIVPTNQPTSGATQPSNQYSGMEITANQTACILNISVSAFGNYTHCFIYNASNNIQLLNASVVNNYCILTLSVKKGQRLYMATGQVNYAYKWATNFPVTNPETFYYLNQTRGFYTSDAGATWNFLATYVADITGYWVDDVCFPSGTTGVFVNITRPYPDEHFNDIVFVNATSNQSVLCSINDTSFSPHFNNATFYSWNKSNQIDGLYSIFVNCTNSTGGQPNNDTVNYYVDTTNPAIATSFVNGTVFLLGNITARFNLSDNILLYSYNISIDGINKDGKQNLGGTFYQVNFTYNASNLSASSHILSLRVADAHTKNIIPDYDITSTKNDLTFSFKGKGYVTITSLNVSEKWMTEKKIDRYSFQYTPMIEQSEYYFVVKSSDYIDIVEAGWTKYKKWLIVDEHWLDFHNEGSSTKFIRLSANEVKVIVTTATKQKAISFNSIGDLNIVTQNYSFYLVNATETHSSPVVEGSDNQFSLNFNYASGIVSSITSYVRYNNTNYNVSKTTIATKTLLSTIIVAPFLSNDTVIPFIWYFSIDGNAFNISGNQIVLNIGFDNCSNYTQLLANFTVLDENTLEAISPTDLQVEVTLTSLITGTTIKYFNATNKTSLQICVPNNITQYMTDSYKIDIGKSVV